ncbi:uncharacterized protein LOC121926089 [Sceloporus undulatus]|uniref:uncharacterized protein LOC121926089 n=1 Tax=Sceloporus undulatus TaxID=8520 RepID=UPI001C4D1DDC|nr:uncharacterized protein LOC121926089 [Sceloporus undulatus]
MHFECFLEKAKRASEASGHLPSPDGPSDASAAAAAAAVGLAVGVPSLLVGCPFFPRASRGCCCCCCGAPVGAALLLGEPGLPLGLGGAAAGGLGGAVPGARGAASPGAVPAPGQPRPAGPRPRRRRRRLRLGARPPPGAQGPGPAARRMGRRSGSRRALLLGPQQEPEQQRRRRRRGNGARPSRLLLLLVGGSVGAGRHPGAGPQPRRQLRAPAAPLLRRLQRQPPKVPQPTPALPGYECLTPAQRNHCENQLKRRPGHGKGRSQRSSERVRREEAPVGLCEIHFLPTVVAAHDPKHLQKLHCMDLRGFSPCPQPLPLVSSSSTAAYCELNKNTRRCHRQQLPMYKSCRMYQTCDHAVLIAGGWQEQVTYPHHAQNLLLFYQMLRRNGFRQEHIKAFFASEGQASVAVEMGDVHPATEKLAIRSHLALLCRSLHCADSLVLYFNSPAASDGTMLLWDANHNGIADPKERYPITELLADLENCNARRVLLFLDQSYPGPLAKKLRASRRHPNVVLVRSTGATTGGSAFAEFWAGLKPDQCLLQHILPVGPWSAVLASGVPTQLFNVTLAGAPCHSVPPLSEEERQRHYQGCQNLPTMLWYQSRHQQLPQEDE